jgi:hypothetical protein
MNLHEIGMRGESMHAMWEEGRFGAQTDSKPHFACSSSSSSRIARGNNEELLLLLLASKHLQQ